MKISKALAVRTGVALATVAIGAGISAQAAEAVGSSTGHSADVKVGAYKTVGYSATCPMGQRIDGDQIYDQHGVPTEWVPNIKVSNFWVVRTGAAEPIDGADGVYRGFSIRVHDNFWKSETSTISWTCDA